MDLVDGLVGAVGHRKPVWISEHVKMNCLLRTHRYRNHAVVTVHVGSSYYIRLAMMPLLQYDRRSPPW
jgi:hypothetical protein